MSAPASVPSHGRALGLVAAYAVRQVAWSRRTFVIVLLLLLPSLVAALVRGQAPPGSMDDFFREALPSFHLWIVGLVTLFFGAGLVRDGLEDHTLGYLLTRPLGRRRIALGLYLGLMLVVLPLVILAVLVSVGAAFGGQPRLLEDAALPGLVGGLVGTVGLAALVYGALFLWAGFTFKRPAIIGALWFNLFDWGFGFLPGPPRRLSVSAYLEETLVEGFTSRASVEELNPEPFGMNHSLVLLGAILVIALLLAARRAARRDYVLSGDDA